MIKVQAAMRRRIVSLARCLGVSLALVVTGVAGGQEVVLGSVDGFAGDCDGPGTPCNAGSGFVGVFGWALASTPVERVEILVESVQFPGNVINLGRAIYGLPRPDVTAVYPGFPAPPLPGGPGWTYNINSTLFANGQYDVWARVVTAGGSTVLLDAKQVLFTNNEAVLRPFGEIDRPGQNEDVFGTCDRDSAQIRYAVISGWALDLGLSDEDTGISWVELATNGSIVGNTRTSCVFDRERGGLTNCYGLPRIDLERRFPFAFDAPSAGYRFVLDVGAMLNAHLVTPGSNELIVRAGDWSNQFEDIDRVSVNFFCAEDFSEPAFGAIEAPREGRLYSGTVPHFFQGWALDGEGVDRVEVYVDGNFIPGTQYGEGLGTRPLVAADYPGFQDSPAPVWRQMSFDTTTLTNGFHTLQVRVVDDEGDANFIGGEVTFRVENTDLALLRLYKSVGIGP